MVTAFGESLDIIAQVLIFLWMPSTTSALMHRCSLSGWAGAPVSRCALCLPAARTAAAAAMPLSRTFTGELSCGSASPSCTRGAWHSTAMVALAVITSSPVSLAGCALSALTTRLWNVALTRDERFLVRQNCCVEWCWLAPTCLDLPRFGKLTSSFKRCGNFRRMNGSNEWDLCEYVRASRVNTILPPSPAIFWIYLGGKPKRQNGFHWNLDRTRTAARVDNPIFFSTLKNSKSRASFGQRQNTGRPRRKTRRAACMRSQRCVIPLRAMFCPVRQNKRRAFYLPFTHSPQLRLHSHNWGV